MTQVISVSRLNLYAKSLLEGDSNLSDVAVEGELSNYKRYPSGHAYFSLKDKNSQVKGVMFASYFRNLNFVPENGMKVILRGKVSLYERDGTFQINATNMFLSGEGEYRIEFERIKNKLEKEGLFDQSRKKKLPRFPFTIGIATAEGGAAIKGVESVLARRFPCVKLIHAPCGVQGNAREQSIIDAIDRLERIDEVELIIITRGGGSREDLWIFNSERIARRAARCTKPTISAIGHEIDFSILDFVCDVRAATPTAAAEIAVPDISSVRMGLDGSMYTIESIVKKKTGDARSTLNMLRASRGFASLESLKSVYSENVSRSMERIRTLFDRKLENSRHTLTRFSESIEANNPLGLLKRGYAVINDGKTYDKENGFTAGETLKLTTFTQVLDCRVEEVKERE